MGVRAIRALLFGRCTKAPDFGKSRMEPEGRPYKEDQNLYRADFQVTC